MTIAVPGRTAGRTTPIVSPPEATEPACLAGHTLIDRNRNPTHFLFPRRRADETGGAAGPSSVSSCLSQSASHGRRSTDPACCEERGRKRKWLVDRAINSHRARAVARLRYRHIAAGERVEGRQRSSDLLATHARGKKKTTVERNNWKLTTAKWNDFARGQVQKEERRRNSLLG